jgi:hypothetical protein
MLARPHLRAQATPLSRRRVEGESLFLRARRFTRAFRKKAEPAPVVGSVTFFPYGLHLDAVALPLHC